MRSLRATSTFASSGTSLVACVLGLSVALGCAPVARAQDRSPTEEARALFQEGIALADRGDWATAVTRFRDALALRDTPTIRYNLARCLQRLARYVEALEQLDALENGERATALVRRQAAQIRADVEPRIGRIVVQVRGAGADHYVTLDDRPLDPTRLADPIPVDPGTRHVALHAGDRVLERIEVVVPEGGAAHVVLSAAIASAVAAEPTPAGGIPSPSLPEGATSVGGDRRDAPSTSEPSVLESWWLWTIVGVAVAAGVGVGVGVAVADQPPGASIRGDFFSGVLEVR